MARIFSLVLTVLLLLPNALSQAPDTQGLANRSEIVKLAEITLTDHSTIFFEAFPDSTPFAGYIRNGRLNGIMLGKENQPDPRYSEGIGGKKSAVSRDGTRIAYGVYNSNSSGCQIMLHDLRSGNETRLATTETRPASMSWSWDDTEIVYGQQVVYDSRPVMDIFAVSVKDGNTRRLGRLRIDVTYWELLAIEWLHDRPELVLDVSVCIQDQINRCTMHWQTLLFFQSESRVLAVGVRAAVSPVDNRIAYIADDKLWLIDADGSNRRALTSVPASPWSKIVWSPQGDRLWFSTILDEGGNTDVYLVDVRNGRRKRVLRRTLARITAWRP